MYTHRHICVYTYKHVHTYIHIYIEREKREVYSATDGNYNLG